jgi:PTH1 family peptidyl-tRNA hydrolase
MCIDEVANHFNVEFNLNKFNGLYTTFNYNGDKIILLKPQKYMNLSGEVVKKYVDFFKINIEDILIINDDLDLPVGKIKIKFRGSCGGHNGLRNIEQNLSTSEYKRIKIGISNNKLYDTKDYVLGKFNTDDLNLINETLDKIPQIFDDYIKISFDKLMSKYN